MLQKPVLYLSDYFKKHRQLYYEWLQATRDNGDWEGWLGLFLQGVAEVSAQATETARRIQALREAHLTRIAENLAYVAGNGHRVLEHLFSRPIMSVRFGPFFTRVITATQSEAPHVLDGLHHHAHQTDLRIAEHYTDTDGATDHVFGFCHLLGYRFAPRIKDLKDRKLYTVKKPAT